MPGYFVLGRPARLRAAQPDVEFYRLYGAKPDGAVVARYCGRDVCDVVIDEYGHRYVFAGVAPRLFNGNYDVRGLKIGEVILEPGLIYQLIPVKRHDSI
ncbi:MAG TPA: hypothetical protein VND94_18500 [Terriglobia bacterium]|nr:hypothetical protein [Terriglobia bacterium]